MTEKLTKANLLKFAKDIYHETKTKIIYTPLYGEFLCSTNGEAVHCAIGEMYTRFIGPIATKKNGKWERLDIGTSGAVFALRELIKPNDYELYHMLDHVIALNDSVDSNGEEAMIKRAKLVSKQFIKIANKYL